MPKEAPRQGELVTGRIPVLECLRARRRPAKKLYLLATGKGLDELREAARSIPVVNATRDELDRISGEQMHQGAVLQAGPLPLVDLSVWLERDLGPQPFCAVLDEVEDPHNFGAIVRSAAALGAGAVIFGKDRAAPLSPAALKSAAGAMEHIPLIQVVNIARALDDLKKANFWCAALDAVADKDLWHADLKGRTAIVIGNEGDGLRRLVRETCDYTLRIPIAGPITSLNASVSAALALAECARQRAK
jgi:23S rRNA (guanosine2251-2'-O)-methyltransferase